MCFKSACGFTLAPEANQTINDFLKRRTRLKTLPLTCAFVGDSLWNCAHVYVNVWEHVRNAKLALRLRARLHAIFRWLECTNKWINSILATSDRRLEETRSVRSCISSETSKEREKLFLWRSQLSATLSLSLTLYIFHVNWYNMYKRNLSDFTTSVFFMEKSQFFFIPQWPILLKY